MTEYKVTYINEGFFGENKVGVWINNKNVKVSLPKQMTNKVNDARLLVNTLEKYMVSISNQKSVVRTSDNYSVENVTGTTNISTLFEIIDDYLENGYYISKTPHYSDKVGRKIDFNRTIKKVTPHYYQNTFIYPRLVKKSKVSFEEELLRKIHKFVVYKVSKILEFYYGYLPVDEFKEINLSTTFTIHYLKQELFNTTNDYKRRLITLMLNYFEGLGSNDSIDLFIETSSFDVIWEEMLRSIFSNAKSSDFYFNTNWYLYSARNNVIKRRNRDSQLDLIRIDTDENLKTTNVYIIDAKYYSYNYNDRIGTLPQTTDINKQIGYMYFVKYKIKQLIPNYNINFYNVFMLPYENHKIIKTFGYATSEMDLNEKIIGLNVDIRTVMQQYVRPNKISKLNTLFIEEIKCINI